MIPLKQESQGPAAFIGRQPIFDVNQKVYAYELLFRSGNVGAANVLDDNKATAQVIYNSLMEIGLDELVGPHLAFINFPRDLLINDIPQLLPPERVVLEILEGVKIDEQLVNRVDSLRKGGFTVALDDFVYDPAWKPLIQYADLIKVDVYENSVTQTEKLIELLRGYDVKLLAEKVETHEEYNLYKQMGFDYFQGYFFAKPNIISRERPPDNHVALLQLISRLYDPEVSMEEIDVLVSQTVSLSYKLFRYINSAFFGMPRKFQSIREIVIYFGLQKLKDMACLIAMTEINKDASELILTGLTRAKMCESLGKASAAAGIDTYFITGLFSILGALLGQPLDTILKQLPLEESVAVALLNREGGVGKALSCSIGCEECRWPEIKFDNLEASTIYKSYVEAMTWARQATAGLVD